MIEYLYKSFNRIIAAYNIHTQASSYISHSVNLPIQPLQADHISQEPAAEDLA